MDPIEKRPLPKPLGFSILRAIQAGWDPEGFFISQKRKGDDPFCLRLPGVGKIYTTGHPEGAREIYSAPRETFSGFKSNVLEPLVGLHSVMVLDGSEHQRERRMLSPPFQGDEIVKYGKVIQEVVSSEIQKWSANPRFLAIQSMRSVTLQVIIRAVFGVQGKERQEHFATAMESFLEGYTPSLLLLPFLRRRFFGVGPWSDFVGARKRLDDLMVEEIQSRRQILSKLQSSVLEQDTPAVAEGASPFKDVLSLLIQSRDELGQEMKSDVLKDQLQTLLVAGHETSATAITWALYFAHYHEEVRVRLQNEVRALGKNPSPDDLVKLPYLQAVCNEALRIHPVVPITIRKLNRPLSLRGVEIPAGEHVAVSLTLVHRYEEVWKNPEIFDPQRFLERKYSHYEFIPFGGGHRRCLGASFALYEMKVVLGTIFAQCDLALQAPTRRVRPSTHNITTGPKGGIPMVFKAMRI